ncbi:proline-specific permease [Cladophialophora carrionii]|uniref:Proline-specific permease n=1 Tax=Cladophialophora carrionii TaxID=86049 RepID=A0A1C1CB41_9EURO|nr:proline-specific permease [Cladophialophora carrionii]
MAATHDEYPLTTAHSNNGEGSSSRGSSSQGELAANGLQPRAVVVEARRGSEHTQRSDGGDEPVDYADVDVHDDSGEERVNTSLRRDLGERHVNMIAFSCVIGIGLFLQNGRIINLAGPGMAWLAYPLMGSIVWSVQAALGEMTALFPVPGALFELPCRFFDQSIGYAVGWMSWFAWVVIIAAELQGVAGLFQFGFSPADLQRLDYPEPSLKWSTSDVDPAVWISIFLVLTLAVNLVRVRWFGEIEYWIGLMKMVFIVGLILFNIGINIETGTHFRFYNDPWGFISRAWITPSGDEETGGWGHLAGVWSAMTLTIFSMIGFEAVTVTAAENRELRTFEGVKISSRKIAMRIILLYSLATFTVGLNVPYDEPLLVNREISALDNGTHSAFVLAAIRAGKTFWPRFFNGFFILSATSSGINSLYLSSRILHALALSEKAWPRFLRKFQERLQETGSQGVPRNAVFLSWLFGFLGYLAAGKTPSHGLRLTNGGSMKLASSAARIPRASIDPGQDLGAYSRKKTTMTYPYRSNWQPLRTCYALFGCTMLILFNGWRSISPFSGADFVASYISVSLPNHGTCFILEGPESDPPQVFIFIALCVLYRWHLHRQILPRLQPTLYLRHPVMVDLTDEKYGRDKLAFGKEDNLSTKIVKTGEWIWVWLK